MSLRGISWSTVCKCLDVDCPFRDLSIASINRCMHRLVGCSPCASPPSQSHQPPGYWPHHSSYSFRRQSQRLHSCAHTLRHGQLQLPHPTPCPHPLPCPPRICPFLSPRPLSLLIYALPLHHYSASLLYHPNTGALLIGAAVPRPRLHAPPSEDSTLQRGGHGPRNKVARG